MKMEMKMKHRLDRYNIDKSRHGHKSKYKKCLRTIMLIGINQHHSLSNI